MRVRLRLEEEGREQGMSRRHEVLHDHLYHGPFLHHDVHHLHDNHREDGILFKYDYQKYVMNVRERDEPPPRPLSPPRKLPR